MNCEPLPATFTYQHDTAEIVARYRRQFSASDLMSFEQLGIRALSHQSTARLRFLADTGRELRRVNRRMISHKTADREQTFNEDRYGDESALDRLDAATRSR